MKLVHMSLLHTPTRSNLPNRPQLEDRIQELLTLKIKAELKLQRALNEHERTQRDIILVETQWAEAVERVTQLSAGDAETRAAPLSSPSRAAAADTGAAKGAVPDSIDVSVVREARSNASHKDPEERQLGVQGGNGVSADRAPARGSDTTLKGGGESEAVAGGGKGSSAAAGAGKKSKTVVIEEEPDDDDVVGGDDSAGAVAVQVGERGDEEGLVAGGSNEGEGGSKKKKKKRKKKAASSASEAAVSDIAAEDAVRFLLFPPSCPPFTSPSLASSDQPAPRCTSCVRFSRDGALTPSLPSPIQPPYPLLPSPHPFTRPIRIICPSTQGQSTGRKCKAVAATVSASSRCKGFLGGRKGGGGTWPGG